MKIFLRRAGMAAVCFCLAGASARLRADDDKTGAAEPLEARITRMDGTVYVHLHDHPEGEFIPAETGTSLEEGDHVRTGSDGTAELSLDGDSLIEVSPDSDFTVASLAPEHASFQLGWGRLMAKIRTLLPSQRMEFSTPTAVAAVRGTELAVAQAEGQPAHVGVFDEGHVSVTSPQGGAGAVMVGPGQETEVATGRRPARVHALRVLSAQRGRMAWIRRRGPEVRREWQRRTPEERRARREVLKQRQRIRAKDLKNVRASRDGGNDGEGDGRKQGARRKEKKGKRRQ